MGKLVTPKTQEEGLDNNSKRPLWARKILEEGDEFATPSGTFRE